ncbi:Pre-mRNA-splicing factor cwc15 [Senna tora]|uniref:Pre-mRNA-splicing factor cwc15 n=1 Tax=Senna tora TaxID=362788 RepID=A0A834W565_9FABA|nr:Pre-mRNA-splicing factor cwc15 [Senna tora]
MKVTQILKTLEELPMEVISDGVIDESLGCLGFTTGLVLEHHIIIPPKAKTNPKKTNEMLDYLAMGFLAEALPPLLSALPLFLVGPAQGP